LLFWYPIKGIIETAEAYLQWMLFLFVYRTNEFVPKTLKLIKNKIPLLKPACTKNLVNSKTNFMKLNCTLFLLVFAISLAKPISTTAQVDIQDSLALVALYNSTDGPNWLRHDNWLTSAPVSSWDGVYLTGNRVSEMFLYSNKVQGSLPPELGKLTGLVYLNLWDNQLTGNIPPELGKLTGLGTLILSNNQLTGSIPPELGKLTQLPNLDLSNNQLTGSIPPELGKLIGLTDLDLSNNQLSGSIPPELGSLTFPGPYSTSLDLSNNQLSGSIPRELGKLTGLTSLQLYNNQLSGSIPQELENITRLSSLILFNNQLTGSIPTQLSKLKLWDLDLGNNQLTGNIPPELGSVAGLGYLYLNGNQLTGSMPPQLGNLTTLLVLYLSNNQLTGSIPPELGNLAGLYDLSLNNNQLTGSIPPELGNLIHLGLHYFGQHGVNHGGPLNLSNNQLSGSIPSTLGNLKNLSQLYLNNNQLSGKIPPQLSKLHNLSTLCLDSNQLRGNIPAALGNLTNLVELKLSDNFLTGQIPASFSNLVKLSRLNINHNKFSGMAPAFLAALPELQRLNLLRNNYTFDGMEELAQHNFSVLKYYPQKQIDIHQTGNTLSVYAGGTLSNNTYKWFKDGALAATIAGDSTYHPTIGGAYTVQITNSIATALTLYSDTVNYAAINGLIASQTNDLITGDNNTRVSLYPNPAKTSVTIAFNTTGNYTIKLTDLSGRVLQTKTGNAIKGAGTIRLIIAGYAKGIYLITVSNNKNQNHTFMINKE
jgi:Leucine-rich repeat (LRR) protein